MIENKCPVCFTHKTREVFHKNFIHYYRCRLCNFLFSGQTQNPNLENRTIGHYEPAYISYLEEAAGDNPNFRKMVESIEKFKSLKHARVLDIGAGSGKFVRFLRQRAIDSYGIEPSEALYSQYLSKEPFFYLTDIKGLKEKSPLVKYDVVFVSDVIEHVQDTHSFFRGLSMVLKPKAVIFISTPDADSFFARLCGKYWHYINKYHFSFFTRKTISALASQYGLKEIGFEHAAHYKSIGFVLQYYIDFILRVGRWRITKKWNQWVIPVNLHDNMQIIFENN